MNNEKLKTYTWFFEDEMTDEIRNLIISSGLTLKFCPEDDLESAYYEVDGYDKPEEFKQFRRELFRLTYKND